MQEKSKLAEALHADAERIIRSAITAVKSVPRRGRKSRLADGARRARVPR